jgi:hypothetical protein
MSLGWRYSRLRPRGWNCTGEHLGIHLVTCRWLKGECAGVAAADQQLEPVWLSRKRFWRGVGLCGGKLKWLVFGRKSDRAALPGRFPRLALIQLFYTTRSNSVGYLWVWEGALGEQSPLLSRTPFAENRSLVR